MWIICLANVYERWHAYLFSFNFWFTEGAVILVQND
jgi:hypothetical protein